MIDWKRKLTSRKFWLAVALFVSGILTATGHEDQATVVSGLIMQGAAVIAYIIGEGLADSGVHYDDLYPYEEEVYYVDDDDELYPYEEEESEQEVEG